MLKPFVKQINKQRFLITADMHLMTDPNVRNAIVPLMDHAMDMLKVFEADVMRLRPDGVILLGDNTNSGKLQEHESLSDCLKRIKEAGIEVLLCPGNHDFGQCDKALYQQFYEWLWKDCVKDPASFSYVKDFNGIRFLVMDDSSNSEGIEGVFCKETMDWLAEQLQMAVRESKHVIFLSHHNLFGQGWMNDTKHYIIQNEDLVSLLAAYQVHLAFTGHLHQQVIHEADGITEIIQNMYMKNDHEIGDLNVVGNTAVYTLRPLTVTDPTLILVMKKKAESLRQSQDKTWTALGLSEAARQEMTAWMTLAESGRLKKNKSYPNLLKELKEPSYRKWLLDTLEHPQRADRAVVTLGYGKTPLQAVLFDMDGILFDSEKYYMDGTVEQMRRYGYDGAKENVYRILGTNMKGTYDILYELLKGRVPYEEIVANNERYFAQEKPIDYKSIMFKGVPEVLEQLRLLGIKTAVCSSSPKQTILDSLSAMGISEKFDYIVSSDEMIRPKPAGDIYLQAAEQLGVPVSGCIVYEDSEMGIAAGKNAGMFVIAREDIRYGQNQSKADIIVKDISEMYAFVQKELAHGRSY